MTACASCAFEGPTGARYCGRCGSLLTAPCPGCGQPNNPELAFCTGCGLRLDPAAAAGGDAALRIPSRDQRRVVTVLFVDLVGWAATAEMLDPEDLRTAQSAYFSAVRRVIERYGGTVEKYIGDAVMSCFGAPLAHDNDAYRAVRAALDIRAGLAGQWLPDGRPLQVRIGVETGEAVVDLGAQPARGEPMVSGDVAAHAARLQAAAAAGGILVGPVAHRMTAADVEYDEGRDLRLRGRSGATQVWPALRLAPRGVDTGHEDAALIGRDGELTLLNGALQRVLQESNAQLVTLVGDPGLGKSRLVRELFAQVEAQPDLIRFRVGRCLPYGEGVTYWALSEIVRLEAGVRDSDSAQQARERLEASVRALLPDADAAAASDRLAPLLGLSAPGGGSEEAGGSWARYLVALTERMPTVLVFEDLHWADDQLLDFLGELLDAAVGAPLLVVCTARPELLDRRPGWGCGARDALQLWLSPLDERETASLFAGLLGQSVLPADVQSRLLELAGGNPLYAEEYVRMLADRGAVARDGAHLSLPDTAALPLPDSVQGIIASRLDLLSPGETAVLQAAAVVGEAFWPGAVAGLAGLPLSATGSLLQALQRRELVRKRTDSTVAGEVEYAFRHILVRDLTYAQIPRARRMDLHERAATWLQGRAERRGDDAAELCAHHRIAAYDLAEGLGLDLEAYAGEARTALCTAAERAYRLRALAPTRTFIDRALELWPAEVDPPGRWRAVRLAQEVCFLADPDAFYAGEGLAVLRSAAAALAWLGARPDAARAETLLGQIEWYRGAATAAFPHVERAVAMLAGVPDDEQKATAHAELARLHMLRHQLAPAIAAARIAREMAERLGLPEVLANSLVTLGTSRYLAGDLGGIVDQETALELCRSRRLQALQRSANNLANTLLEEGQLRRGYELIEESEAAGRGTGLGLTTGASEAEIAMRAWFEGDWDRTLSVASAFLDGEVGGANEVWEVYLRALRGWLRLLRGDAAGGADADRALEIAGTGAWPQVQRPALAYGALCRLLQDRDREAADCYDELDRSWRAAPTTASREWLQATVTAAAGLDRRTGSARLPDLLARLREVPRPTLWVGAALASAEAYAAERAGDLSGAGHRAAAAAGRYDGIGDASDAGLAAVQAAAALAAGGDPAAAEWERRAADFVARTGLLVPAAWALLSAQPG